MCDIIFNKKFEVIIPLGDDCGCAGWLKDCKLRHFSYPFDWLFKISFENRVKLIENHFEDFLVKENLSFFDKKADAILRDDKCDYYEDAKYGTQFLHDFIHGQDFNLAFQDVCEKYDRRIKRLYENVGNAENALFIWRSKRDVLSDDCVFNAYKKLCAVFPETEIFFLIMENDEKAGDDIAKSFLTDHILRITAHITIQNTTDAYVLAKGNVKINNQIFSQIRCKRAPFSFRTWFMKKLIKCFCAFIKPKQKRRQIKAYLMSQLLTIRD